MTSKERPPTLNYQLVHQQQESDWDCGLSCILMVLSRTQRQFLSDNFTRICQEEGFGRSTWTIDLCYLLLRLGVSHEYTTSVLGVNLNYESEKYYKNILDRDEERVNKRFLDAQSFGLAIRKTKLSLEHLLDHLAWHGTIILLTNSHLLSCDTCKDQKLANELRSIFPISTEYSGHYIVLCGYCTRFGKILYRDPSKSDQVCSMSFKQLDLARNCFGTDHDTILLFNKKRRCE